MSIKRFILNLALGVVLGAVYYVVYVMLLPRLIAPGMGLLENVEVSAFQSIDYRVAITLLITIGIMERVIEHPVAAVLRVLSKLVGALLLYIITNGGIFTATIEVDGSMVNVVADLSLLIYSVIIVSAIVGIVDAGSAIVKYSSS
ncbi:MAG: hypothetical protein F7B78_01835 [Desulfurococcales archaeon]|nr:hypothetical protein [Desulfurococcales archaeon]